jgi:hypothetical protein
MTERRDIREDLGPEAPDDLIALAERLERERPVPTAAFRGELRRRLMTRGGAADRPAHLRARIAAFACSGSMLLLAGALSAAGVGPLGA